MPQWTKKAAIERMKANTELQQVYERYPLAQLLVESAAKLKRYHAYHRISCHYAYKDWMRAVMGWENEAFFVCIRVIDDLLPPDAADLQLEGKPAISVYNPSLPDLPPRPEYSTASKGYRLLTISEVKLEANSDASKQRSNAMRAQLEEIAQARKAKKHESLDNSL